jgi:hypothetical protein
MCASLNNIKFSYLYRDYGNYKLFGETIFSNPENISLSEIDARIKAKLIDGEYFNPEAWGIPRLSFENYIPEQDHDWHEFEGVEITEVCHTTKITIAEFLLTIENIRIKPADAQAGTHPMLLS